LLGDGAPRALSELLSFLGPRRASDAIADVPPPPFPPGLADEPVFPTKALHRFLTGISSKPAPVLLDLGPVVGSNLTFFGEQLGCKIIIEDLFRDLDRQVAEPGADSLAARFADRFSQHDFSVDGVLCWDLFDYLEPAAARALARELTRMLRVDGVLLGFFSTVPSQDARYTKFVIADETNLRQRPYPATRSKQRVLLNRDIIKLFEGLRVAESFLLKTNVREILFRKPEYLGRP
jgi:hypothetical protein